MKVYLMRHGPAENQAVGGQDSDRALTAPGRERVRAVAHVLADRGEAPATIVTSPLVRAVQTAEIVAIVTKPRGHAETVEVLRELSPGGNALPSVQAFAAQGRKRILLVGHEPDLSALASALLAGFERPFDKAMVVALQIPESGPAELRFILDPKTLRIRD